MTLEPTEWATIGLEAASPEAAWKAAADRLAKIGFDQAGLVYNYKLFDQTFPSEEHILGYMVSREWEAHSRGAHVEFKSVFDVVSPSSMGIGVQINALDVLNNPATDQPVYAALGELYERGLVCGWTSPVVNREQGRFSVLMLATSFDGPEFERLIDQYSVSLDLCTSFLVESLDLKERISEAPEGNPLAPRERECLLWASLGRSTKQISHKLNLAESTVNEYLATAAKKLGANNRQHAIAKAILLGVIKP